MADGRIVTHEGPMVPAKRVKCDDQTQALWTDLYQSWLHSRKCVDKTFRQLEGFFAHLYHYHPPHNLGWMPKSEDHWFRTLRDVPRDMLIGA
jgi:hypothetical protein